MATALVVGKSGSTIGKSLIGEAVPPPPVPKFPTVMMAPMLPPAKQG